MEPKTKQYLLITVVGVTLFVALLRLSSVLTFAAQLVDLVLPILAGGILALFINVPMTGLEKRLKRLFCKAKKQPSDKATPSPELLHHPAGCCAGVGAGADIADPGAGAVFSQPLCTDRSKHPPLDRLSQRTGCRHGVADELAGGHRLGSSCFSGSPTRIDTVLVNAVGAVSATVNIVVTASFALIISVYMSVGSESLCHHARTLVCAYLKPSHSACAAEVLPTVPAILCKLSDRAMQ
ncbi:MAG: hypothetical protein ACLUFD_00030 [Faecalibacterium sp.]